MTICEIIHSRAWRKDLRSTLGFLISHERERPDRLSDKRMMGFLLSSYQCMDRLGVIPSLLNFVSHLSSLLGVAVVELDLHLLGDPDHIDRCDCSNGFFLGNFRSLVGQPGSAAHHGAGWSAPSPAAASLASQAQWRASRVRLPPYQFRTKGRGVNSQLRYHEKMIGWRAAVFLEPHQDGHKTQLIHCARTEGQRDITFWSVQRITMSQESCLHVVCQGHRSRWSPTRCFWCSCFMRGTRPYRHICLPLLVRAGLASSYCMRSQPRGGTPQQVHACLLSVMDCPDTRRILPLPPLPGAKVSERAIR